MRRMSNSSLITVEKVAHKQRMSTFFFLRKKHIGAATGRPYGDEYPHSNRGIKSFDDILSGVTIWNVLECLGSMISELIMTR